MSFHTIGDSHANHGWCKIPEIITHELGPWTAYSVGRDGLNRLNISGLVASGDSVCFCFGEIDCRCYIHKHVTDEFPAHWAIGQIVSDYLAVLDLNAKLVSGIKVYVYSVPPAVRREGQAEAPDLPFLGSNFDRVTYVRLFNEMLFYHSKPYGFLPINVHDKYADKDRHLLPQFSDGSVHIQDPVFIVERLKENGYL